jgi:hypothetical protein
MSPIPPIQPYEVLDSQSASPAGTLAATG